MSVLSLPIARRASHRRPLAGYWTTLLRIAEALDTRGAFEAIAILGILGLTAGALTELWLSLPL